MAETRSIQLNVRLPKELVRELESIAETEHLDRTAVVRKLLSEGIARWRFDYAMSLYQKGKVTMARAAEIAGVSIYEILDEIQRRRIPSQYTLEEVSEDIRDMLQRGKQGVQP